MSKGIKMYRFMQNLFDAEGSAQNAAEIGQAILAAHSLRLTEMAANMRGSSEVGNKRIQQTGPREALWRLFQEQTDFVLGDPTEIERLQAWKTDDVGTLKGGKTKGFWDLLLATP